LRRQPTAPNGRAGGGATQANTNGWDGFGLLEVCGVACERSERNPPSSFWAGLPIRGYDNAHQGNRQIFLSPCGMVYFLQ